ncbi:MAG: hypothetical protein QG597_3044 [Actinomycetota bacterium]|nr:hypothetical protein [Actinomycetota bacterium]
MVGESATIVVKRPPPGDAGESPTTLAGEHRTTVYPTIRPQAALPPAASISGQLAPLVPAVVAVTQAPGWYPDPWSGGEAGKVRYWDGARWTGYATDTASAPIRRNLGVPGWLLGLWSGVVLLVCAGLFPVVLLMGAFACDSGWEGCSTASSNAIVVYVLVAALVAVVPALLAVLVGRGTRTGRALRIIALVLIPLAPVVAVVTGFLVISAAFPDTSA